VYSGEIVIAQPVHLGRTHSDQFRSIFISSFPAPERGDFDELVSDIAKGVRVLFAALTKGDFIGFAVTLRLKPSDIHVLEYLAVDEAHRNRGIGAQLLRGAGGMLKTQSNAEAIILEVEPDDEGGAEERQLRARRIQFYQRLGAKLIDCALHYCAPNLAGVGTVNFRLMWLPLTERTAVPTGTSLRNCLINLYSQSYELAEDDPIVEATLNGLTC
jgi:ribosomal protein S18 acetylase RimI-like enzyme